MVCSVGTMEYDELVNVTFTGDDMSLWPLISVSIWDERKQSHIVLEIRSFK